MRKSIAQRIGTYPVARQVKRLPEGGAWKELQAMNFFHPYSTLQESGSYHGAPSAVANPH
jgi:hypothetical protein